MSVYMMGSSGARQPGRLKSRQSTILVGNMTLTKPHPNKDEIMTKYHI